MKEWKSLKHQRIILLDNNVPKLIEKGVMCFLIQKNSNEGLEQSVEFRRFVEGEKSKRF